MEITVRMFSHFQKHLPADAERDRCVVQTDQGISIAVLLELLEIPDHRPRVITVNDTNRKEDFILEDKDVVKIFPVAMGG
jgi:hypothetical protein